jgi:predicted molibdopterin-dependent oxidoreductase YjgC
MKKETTYQTATIDGQIVKIRRGQSVLDAASRAGIYVPTLCHLENLEPYGGCRLCVVEVEDMKGTPTACTTPIVPGMVIRTNSPELQKLRKEILEFTLSEHPFTCLVCKDKKECTDFMHTTRKVSTITGCNFCTSNGDCELQELVDFLELEDMKFPITYRGIPPVHDNPFYSLDYNLCILCGRCVRICNEERNSHVLAFVDRGNTSIVGTAFSESQAEAGCEFCGACVDVCPTGSISERMGKWRGMPDKSVKTTCVICPIACEMNVNSRNGKLVQIGPQAGKRTDPHQLCLRGKFLPTAINDHPSRITSPLIKRENKWVEVSWKEAFEYTSRKLQGHKGNEFGLIASGQDTLEDNYTLQKFTRKAMNSNNVDMHGSYPIKEIPEKIHKFRMLNSPAGLADIEKADTLLLLGMDASVSHPLLENRIRKAFRSGKKVISYAAHPSRTSTFVTNEVHYQPGEEMSLLLLLQKKEVRSILSESREVAIIAGDELLRQSSSLNIIQDLFSLHAALSKDHKCNIIFPGFEGNLYGNALAGVHPGYLPGFQPVSQKAAGKTCNEMIRSAGENGITAMMVVGDLPAHPGLENLDFLVQCNMFETEMSEYADVFLPVTDFLESEGHILSMEGRMKRVNKAVQQAGNVLSIAGIVAGLAKAMGEPGFSRRSAEIFRELKPLLEIREQKLRRVSLVKDQRQARGEIIESPEIGNGFPVSLMLRYDHFKYRGNRLSDLVTDLGSISEEGELGLPDSLMLKLKVKEGDHVRIVSEYGEMNSVVCSGAGQNCHTACLLPTSSDSSGILGGVYPEDLMINVMIEKVLTRNPA